MDHEHARAPISPPGSPAPTTKPLTRPAPRGAPAPTRQRFSAIDTLRGFALLGILVPNIWYFAWPMVTGMAPALTMGDTPANRIAHDLTLTLFLGKFMFLFALLFGAGVVMYGRKFDAADEHGRYHTPLATGAGLWHTRCLVLLGVGLAHAYLFWYGDILTFYAAAGLTLLWWLRRLNPRVQLFGGLALYALGAALGLTASLMGYWAYQTGRITFQDLMGGDPATEITAYTGTFLDALKARALTTLLFQLFYAVMILPMLWGIMSMGMGLTRLNILTGARPMRFYVAAACLLIPTGLAITIPAHRFVQANPDAFVLNLPILPAQDATPDNASADPTPHIPGFLWQSMAQPLGIPLALGYGALIIALSKAAWARGITAPLAAVGRMALTNYLAQTLLCTTIFYGYGLGYFAKIEYPSLWLVVAGVWAFNIVFSLLWLRAFTMGPCEWAWRCLTYRRLVPVR